MKRNAICPSCHCERSEAISRDRHAPLSGARDDSVLETLERVGATSTQGAVIDIYLLNCLQ